LAVDGREKALIGGFPTNVVNTPYRSEVFPGLWLDARAIFTRDHGRRDGILERGLATSEHADFVAKLAQARGRHKRKRRKTKK
jgi:hypothetical protein